MAFGHFASAFWTLLTWSLEALTLPPLLLFLSAALLSLIAAFIRQKPFKDEKWKSYCWVVLVQLAFFPAVVAVGALFPAHRAYGVPSPNSIGNWACDILGILSLVTGAVWVYRMKGFRWFAASLVLSIEMVLAGAFFIAGMAVSGDWL